MFGIHIRLMLFQTANCILNYIGGVLKYFQCLGYQKISIWVEAQVWRSPRSEGVALLLDGVTLVAPRATLEPGPGEAILKEIRPGISLEGMMPKLKLQYFDHLMQN